MKTRILSLLVVLMAVFSFVGCGGGGAGGGADTATVTGKVTNMAGEAIDGATVSNGSYTATTDSDGKYSLTVAVTDAGDASVSAKKANFAQNTKIVTVATNGTATQDMKLANVGVVKAFDAAAGATVETKGAKVDLPAGSYKTEDGVAYTGKVTAKVTYNRVTTPNGMEAFPGRFLGEDANGDTKTLQSYGFIDVTLETADGKKLNLNGAEAAMTYPLDPSFEGTPPATIPLWYFDTAKGIWVEDGKATYNAATGVYEGPVEHFTTWNLDAKSDQTTIEGCVQDANGTRVPIADIYITAPGWSKSVSNNDANGEFKFINAPSGITVSLVAVHDGLASNEFNLTLVAGQINTTDDGNGTECLVLDQNASAMFVEVKGVVVDGDNNPVEDTMVSLEVVKSDDGGTSYIGGQSTDANGSFSFSYMRSSIESVGLSVYYNNLSFEFDSDVTPTQTLVDVGTLVVATTTVTGCVTLESGSSTTGGVTTLADGTTTVDDGTTVGDDNRTAFGTHCREFFSNAPYGESGGGHARKISPAYSTSGYCYNTFDADGAFTVTLKKDFEQHDLYAHTFDSNGSKYKLTGSKSITANAKTIDLGTDADECIQLQKIVDVNQSATVTITSTNSDVGLSVYYTATTSQSTIVSTEPKVKTATFNLDRNGKYVINQVVDWSSGTTFNGTMTLVTGGDTYTITIPATATANDMWMAFTVEVYNGSVKVTEVNSGW